MGSLIKDLGNLVMAAACGAAMGASAGYTIECWREAKYGDERQKNHYVVSQRYQMNMGRIEGAGILGGVLGFAVYAFRRGKRAGDGKEDETANKKRNDLDEE